MSIPETSRGGGRHAVGVGALLLLLGTALVAAAAEDKLLQTFLLRASDPDAFATPDVKTTVTQGRVSKNRVMGLSTDQRFTSGLLSGAKGEGMIESYPVDEFMYFTQGELTLTATDGTVTRMQAGDAIHVPQGWKGRWSTPGYIKFYVVYDAAKWR